MATLLSQVKTIIESLSSYRGEANNNKKVIDVAWTDEYRFLVKENERNSPFNNLIEDTYDIFIQGLTVEDRDDLITGLIKLSTGNADGFNDNVSGVDYYYMKIIKGKMEGRSTKGELTAILRRAL